MPFGAEENWSGAYQPRNPYAAPDDQEYLAQLNRGSDIGMAGLNQAGENMAQHYKDMGQIVSDTANNTVQNYMKGAQFSTQQKQAQQQSELAQANEQRNQAHFAEEQGLAPLRRQQMEAATRADTASAAQAEENLGQAKIEHGEANQTVDAQGRPVAPLPAGAQGPQAANTMSRRQQEHQQSLAREKAQADASIAASKGQLAFQSFQLQDAQSQQRIKGAQNKIEATLRQNPNLDENAIVQYVANQDKLQGEEGSIALNMAKGNIASTSRANEVIAQTRPNFIRHQEILRDSDAKFAEATALAHNFMTYNKEQFSPHGGPILQSELADQARQNFSRMIRPSDSLVADKVSAGVTVGAEQTDTLMKRAVMNKLEAMKLDLEKSKSGLGEYANSPDIQNRINAINQMESEVNKQNTGFLSSWADKGADNTAKIPSQSEPGTMTAAQEFFKGPKNKAPAAAPNPVQPAANPPPSFLNLKENKPTPGQGQGI